MIVGFVVGVVEYSINIWKVSVEIYFMCIGATSQPVIMVLQHKDSLQHVDGYVTIFLSSDVFIYGYI